MTSKKSIRDHYNKILRDPEQRVKHFTSSGALGDEKEGRDAFSRAEVSNQNLRARIATMNREDENERLNELKRKGKIEIGNL
jgi:hypothetical protein